MIKIVMVMMMMSTLACKGEGDLTDISSIVGETPDGVSVNSEPWLGNFQAVLVDIGSGAIIRTFDIAVSVDNGVVTITDVQNPSYKIENLEFFGTVAGNRHDFTNESHQWASLATYSGTDLSYCLSNNAQGVGTEMLRIEAPNPNVFMGTAATSLFACKSAE